ncbi:hypothetical protein SKAU_G00112880 [Synaphobranchus kaupii]|uniref:TNFR-Cys domain-containing protein n=1 Tax=Synaphobranchus kaupii TaxID=118154 RepID=A0A9Q1G1L0_SYNKA|nr:hypothetical protein SKAU_G00112880 [Synaphobranchus kaupii]
MTVLDPDIICKPETLRLHNGERIYCKGSYAQRKAGPHLKKNTCKKNRKGQIGKISPECKCVPCPPDKYRVVRSGRPRCEFCTQQCRADRHLVQIKDCAVDSNRECYCDRGYFCESAAQYTCRRCHPCPDGTFMDTTSRRSSCKKHTNCASLGMALTSTGNRTHDQVCAYITTSITHRDLSTTNDLLRLQNATEHNSVVKGTTVHLPTVTTKTFAHEIETATATWNAQTATHHLFKRTLMDAASNTSPHEQSSLSMEKTGSK